VTHPEDHGGVPFRRSVRSVGVVGRSASQELASVLEEVVEFAEAHGLEIYPEASLATGVLADAPSFDSLDQGPDLLLTLGGDGTLLRGARAVPRGTPVVGVNLGRLGFLTSMSVDDMMKGLEMALDGEAWLDLRATLEAGIFGPDDEDRAGTEGYRNQAIWALNDLVLHKGGMARVARLELSIGRNDEREAIGSFTGDGVIVSTPTGSTAYSLSAGGPILAPDMSAVVVTPISPHTLAMRPLVLPARGILTVQATEGVDDLVLTADGQTALPLSPGDRMAVWPGEGRVALVRLPGQTFFDTLQRKLNWAI